MFTSSEIGTVKVTLRARNEGTYKQKTHLDKCKLYINGELSFAWSLALGNGQRSEKWYLLPGKDSVEMVWSHLAASLFSEPGSYSLRLELAEELIQELKVVHTREK
ncbi:MAG TPA: hypothetical protein ENJ82_07275 [Bacteroidetes bacterium]|nr:hypothetical protein [Bacteroidota bacterium]